MRKRKMDDDTQGISLLNSRLRGEKIDDKTADELLSEEDSKRKKDEKKVDKTEETEINKVLEDTESINTTVDEKTSEDVKTDRVEKEEQKHTFVEPEINTDVYNDESYGDDEDETLNRTIQNVFTMVGTNTEDVKTNQSPAPAMMYPNGNVVYGTAPIQPVLVVGNSNVTPNSTQSFIPVQPIQVVSSVQPSRQTKGEQPIRRKEPQSSSDTHKKTENASDVKTSSFYRDRASKPLATRILSKCLYSGLTIAIIAACIWILVTYVFGFTKMPNNSMKPAYFKGETLFIDRISKNFDNPNNNDVVVFSKNNKEYVARIIGIPGDKIGIDEQGTIYINDKSLEMIKKEAEESNSIRHEEISEEDTVIPVYVSELELNANQFYVLCDNKDEIMDSRNPEIGIIEKNEIIGVVLFSFNIGD